MASAALVGTGCDQARTVARQEFTPRVAGVLTVATALPAPGSWEFDDLGNPIGGFEYEIAAALAARFDLRLEVIDVPFEQIVAGDLGGADIALAEITVTGAREQNLAFSTPYYLSGAGVLAAEGAEVPDLKTARDLSWGVRRGTTDEALVRNTIKPDSVTIYPDELACARAVAGGEVEACLLDLPTALVIEGELVGVETVARFVTDEQWAIAFPRDAEALATNIEVVDAGLRALIADGSRDGWADEWLAALYAHDPDTITVIEART